MTRWWRRAWHAPWCSVIWATRALARYTACAAPSKRASRCRLPLKNTPIMGWSDGISPEPRTCLSSPCAVTWGPRCHRSMSRSRWCTVPMERTSWPSSRRSILMWRSFMRSALIGTAIHTDGVSRDPARVGAWLDEWVYGLSDHAAYVRKLGAETMERLKPGSAPAAHVEYGAYP